MILIYTIAPHVSFKKSIIPNWIIQFLINYEFSNELSSFLGSAKVYAATQFYHIWPKEKSEKIHTVFPMEIKNFCPKVEFFINKFIEIWEVNFRGKSGTWQKKIISPPRGYSEKLFYARLKAYDQRFQMSYELTFQKNFFCQIETNEITTTKISLFLKGKCPFFAI